MDPYIQFIIRLEQQVFRFILPTIISWEPYLQSITGAEQRMLQLILPRIIECYNDLPDENTKARDICYLPDIILDAIFAHQASQVESKGQKGTVTYDAKMLERYIDPKIGSMQDNNNRYNRLIQNI